MKITYKAWVFESGHHEDEKIEFENHDLNMLTLEVMAYLGSKEIEYEMPSGGGQIVPTKFTGWIVGHIDCAPTIDMGNYQVKLNSYGPTVQSPDGTSMMCYFADRHDLHVYSAHEVTAMDGVEVVNVWSNPIVINR